MNSTRQIVTAVTIHHGTAHAREKDGETLDQEKKTKEREYHGREDVHGACHACEQKASPKARP